MALKTIPVLPKEYPLFRWEDWPDSRAALVSGGPTRNFQKACWNAIADTLTDAMDEVGIEWKDTYIDGYIPHGRDEIKITGEYGALRAAAFDMMMANLDNIVSLPWPHHVDPNFWGYQPSTQWFWRYDTVFPGYILELVERLNLILEIMRGTGPVLPGQVPCDLGTALKADAIVGRAVYGNVQRKSEANVDVKAVLGKGVPGIVQYPMHSPISLKAQASRAALGEINKCAPVPILVRGTPCPGIAGSTRNLSGSQTFAEGCSHIPCLGKAQAVIPAPIHLETLSLPAMESSVEAETESRIMSEAAAMLSCLGSAEILAPVNVFAGAIQRRALRIDGRLRIDSTVLAVGSSFLSTTMAAKKNAGVIHHAEGTSYPALEVNGTVIAESNSQAELSANPALALSSSEIARVSELCAVTSNPSLDMDTEIVAGNVSASIAVSCEKSCKGSTGSRILSDTSVSAVCVRSPVGAAAVRINCATTCGLDTAWLPPVWVNGGLWIRQAYAVTQYENGELEVS